MFGTSPRFPGRAGRGGLRNLYADAAAAEEATGDLELAARGRHELLDDVQAEGAAAGVAGAESRPVVIDLDGDPPVLDEDAQVHRAVAAGRAHGVVQHVAQRAPQGEPVHPAVDL